MEKEKIIKKARPMQNKPFSLNSVDIIIPYHGQYRQVGRLVESILMVTKSNPYHICLVDDSSPNTSFQEQIKQKFIKDTPRGFKPQVSVVRTNEQVGFGGALQLGFDNTEQPWVVFMHSDCIVSDPNWLFEMGTSLKRWEAQKKSVAMVGAREVFSLDGDYRKLQKDIVLDKPLPLYCAMCPRDLFSHIGGFIKHYEYAWYEEEELAYRMNHYGLKQGICGKSWVRHERGSTINAMCQKQPELMESIMEKNRARCIEDMKKLG